MQQTLLNQGKLSAERAKKMRELGIRSKDDVWFENYEVVKEHLEKGVVLDNKHKRWMQRQKKADISEDKRELIEKLDSHSKKIEKNTSSSV